jgi:hypothetical protein
MMKLSFVRWSGTFAYPRDDEALISGRDNKGLKRWVVITVHDRLARCELASEEWGVHMHSSRKFECCTTRHANDVPHVTYEYVATNA